MQLQAVTTSAATGLTLITIAPFMLGIYLAALHVETTGRGRAMVA